MKNLPKLILAAFAAPFLSGAGACKKAEEAAKGSAEKARDTVGQAVIAIKEQAGQAK